MQPHAEEHPEEPCPVGRDVEDVQPHAEEHPEEPCPVGRDVQPHAEGHPEGLCPVGRDVQPRVEALVAEDGSLFGVDPPPCLRRM